MIDVSLVQGERGATRWSHPVSFQVPRGTAHVIRTRSALSAPLFRLCLGFSEPVSGQVVVDGREPWRLGRADIRALRRDIGSALEPDGLVANLTLRMNLIVPLIYATGLQFEDALDRSEKMLSVMHLTMWADLRPAALPAEVRQTAALARALAPRPSMLMLDNPLPSVDARETRRLFSLCKMQVETMLIATHRNDGILHEFADATSVWDDDGFRMAA
ncbi:MAG: ATP-binding cassette domain-containing protein [Gemmatimonadaceae bacterium]